MRINIKNIKKIVLIFFISILFLTVRSTIVLAEATISNFNNGTNLVITDTYLLNNALNQTLQLNSDTYANIGATPTNSTCSTWTLDGGDPPQPVCATYTYTPWFCDISTSVTSTKRTELCNDFKTTCNNNCASRDIPQELGYSTPNPAFAAAGGVYCDYTNICNNAGIRAVQTEVEKAKEKEINDYISNQGYDAAKVRGIIDSDSVKCLEKSNYSTYNSQMACIDEVIKAISGNPTYKKSNSTDPTAPIGGMTFTELNDMVNGQSDADTTQTPDVTINPTPTNIINSANNQAGGILNNQSVPSVNVTFSASSFQAGSSVTANAITGGFKADNLYYTWYLKRKDCELTDNDYPTGKKMNASGDLVKIDAEDCGSDKIKACDFDEDCTITVNDWKIAATKIIIKNNANSQNSYMSYNASPSQNSEWKINSGEDKNDIDAPNCYINDSSSGLDYELRETSPVFSSCPKDYHNAFATDFPAGKNTAGLDIPKTCIVQLGGQLTDPSFVLTAQCDATDLKNYKTEVKGVGPRTPFCVKDSGDTIFPANSSETAFAKGLIVNSTFPTGTFDMYDFLTPKFYQAPIAPATAFTEKKQIFSQIEKQDCIETKKRMVDSTNGDPTLNPTCGFKRGANMCQHLFAEPAERVNSITGDGNFVQGDETDFWKENIDGINGINEADIVGLNKDKITWMYSPGDEIGVVVEGDSVIATNHANSEAKRTWAFSKGSCDLNKISGVKSFYTEGTGTSIMGFPAVYSSKKMNLNNCLKENLLDPITDGGDSTAALKVDLSASPQNPVNDPAGGGDILKITSTPLNTQNSSAMLYEWHVQKSSSGSNAPIDTTGWLDITQEMIDNKSFTASDKSGLNKKDLAVDLNLPSSIASETDAFYLKIKVKITGGSADGSQNAQGEIIVRVTQQGNGMDVYKISADSTGMLTANGMLTEVPDRCVDKNGKIACPVTQNEIVGVQVSGTTSTTPFSWVINGEAITCLSTVSLQCDGKTMFFPIIGNVGESVDIIAKGLSKDKSGEAVEVSRHFVIVEPGLQIIPEDTGDCGKTCLETNNLCPKYLGAYKDIAGSAYPDCSAEVWQTNEGSRSNVSLTASGQTGFDWTVDGQIMDAFKDQNTIIIPINKQAGESYNIGLATNLTDANKAQMQNVRLALYKNWGIDPAESIVDENQSASLQVDVMPNVNPSVAILKSNFFGASLITHLPEQLMFLLKISLTSILMFFATGLLFAFMPETLFKEKE